MKLPSPFLLRWLAIAVVCLWFICLLTSNFFSIGGGLINAFDSASIEGPKKTIVSTEAECAADQIRAQANGYISFCSTVPMEVSSFRISIKALTAGTVVLVFIFLFSASLQRRGGQV